MTAELAVVTRDRGRPSNAELTASLEAARQVNATLREELRAERLEGRAFAGEVYGLARIGWNKVAAGFPHAALNDLAEIAHKAGRHARQRGAHL